MIAPTEDDLSSHPLGRALHARAFCQTGQGEHLTPVHSIKQGGGRISCPHILLSGAERRTVRLCIPFNKAEERTVRLTHSIYI